jgi:MFS family permease
MTSFSPGLAPKLSRPDCVEAQLSKASRTALSPNAGEYFLGPAIAGASPASRPKDAGGLRCRPLDGSSQHTLFAMRPIGLAIWPRSGLWRHRDYLRLWGAQGISAFGSQITLLALPLVAVLTLDAKAFEVAALSAVELVPFIFLGIPAGVWVDRLRRRPILVLTDIGRGASLLSIPVAYELNSLTLTHLYAVAVVNGVLTVFFTLAYQAYVPSLVEREQLVEANSKFEATETVARLGGPASAGGLVSLLSAPVAILTDSLSFFASGSLIVSIKKPEARPNQPHPSAQERSFANELRDGGRFALQDPYVRSVLAITVPINIGFGSVWAILLVYAVRELGLSAGLVGVALSAGEVGGLLGAATASRLVARAGPGPVIIGAAALFGPSLLILAVAPKGMPLPFLVLGWALNTFAAVIYNSTTVGLRQARTPPRLQGRVVGFNRTVVWGVGPLGALLGGALAASAGLRYAMVTGAAIAFAAIIPALVSPLRTLRSMPGPADLGRPAAA